MLLHLGGPAAGALLGLCRGCEVKGRRHVPDIVRIEDADTVPRRASGVDQCLFCAWCGTAMHIPEGRCAHHGRECPMDACEDTVQAARIVKHVRRLYAELTDAGWALLAEEIRITGPGGHPTPGAVVEALVADPHYSRDCVF